MKRIALVLFLLLMLVAGRAVFSVGAQSSQFIIENADEVNTLSFTASSALSDLIAQAAPRIVFQHAHSNRYIALTSIPTALSDRLADIQPRLIVQHARANRYLNLTPPTTPLDTLLSQLLPRIVFQHARANRFIEMRYPVALIGDITPPQGSNITVKPAGETSTTITWTTDEYADSTVRCGIQSGNYTMTFSDPLYVKQHSITLTDLTAGITYYCVCSSTDLSGNTYQSQEFSFEQVEETFIYLPLVSRNN